MIVKVVLGVAVALLAACSSGNDGHDSRDRATAKGEAAGTTFAASADSKTGNVKLAFPGAKLDIDVPAEMFAGANLEMDGIKLYPGSKIDTVNVVAKDRAGSGRHGDEAKVDMGFTSPATPAVVRAWMLAQTAHLDRPLVAVGDGLTGRSRDGHAIAVALTPLDGGRTRGAIKIAG